MPTMINKIIFLSSQSPQAQALRLCIPPKLKVNLTIDDIDSHPLKLNYQSDTLLLIDLACLDDETEVLFQQKLKNCSASLALLNAKDDITLDEIVCWPNICGYFNYNDGFDVICKGLKAMMAGEYWLSPSFVVKLVDHYRNHQINNDIISYESESSISLTYREKEILAALTKKTSNRDIAHQLFISECTIKSHLYNIFRKINVKNRRQAIVWAKSNLH